MSDVLNYTTKLFIDYETWSAVPIKWGTDVYTDHVRPLIITYAYNDEPVRAVDLTEEELPKHLTQGLNDPSVLLVAHNVYFDRMVMRKSYLDIPINRWHCTYAQAMAHGLPGGLGPLCIALGVPEDMQKHLDGMRLIRLFCGPKEFTKFGHEDDWQKFIDYAIGDIDAMRECFNRMPNWNYRGFEKRVWELDQTINNRGFKVDPVLAQAAVDAMKREKEKFADWTNQATGGAVTAATQRDKLLMYLCEQQGCWLPDLKARTIEEALEDESLEETTRELLRVRREASKTSTSKYTRMQSSVGADGRLRGTLQYAGANRTMRWAGRIFQPQNLPRVTLSQQVIRWCVEWIIQNNHEYLTLFTTVTEACGQLLRSLIVADEGKWLLFADFSAIEGRVLAWLADEMWKITAFKNKEDLYIKTIERSLGLPAGTVTKKDPRRQWGKVQELALGYQGGVGAFVSMVSAYPDVDLGEMGRAVPSVAPDDVMGKANDAWELAVLDNRTFGLTKEVYEACDALKIMYRRANPAIEKFWYMLQDAARKVILAGDKVPVQVGRVVFDCNGKWLRIKLPSGRFICYALPKVSTNGTISYMAWRNKKWSRTKTYGGKFAENIVQAVSRDLLACALVRLEEAGYPIVLHVHDEAGAEVPLDSPDKNLEDFIKIMSENPSWAKGLPLNADGFEGARYEK